MSPIPPWSDLAPELLSAIANFLQSNPIDSLRFRCVCKSWYSSVPSLPPRLLSPLFPLTIPSPPLHFYFFYLADSCALSATAVCILRPPNGVQIESSSSIPRTWIAFIDQLNPGLVSIRRPFSRSGFVLPLDFPRKLNLLDFHVSEIGRYYSVNAVNVECGKLVRSIISTGDVDKVVVFSNGSGVVVLFGEGKLGLLRLGVRNDVMGTGNEWQMIHDDKDVPFDDIVDFKCRMLGIDCKGRLYEMRYHSLALNVIVPSVLEGSGRQKRLIESLSLLYLVVRYDNHGALNETSRFKVYVLNEEVRKWVEVASIDDRIFIFGFDFSMSTPAEEFEGSFEKNCIIFTECSFRKYGSGCLESLLGTTPRPSALTVAVYRLKDGNCLHGIESSPGYSCILWPPPTWLWLNNKLKLLGTFETAIERLHEGNCDENLKERTSSLWLDNWNCHTDSNGDDEWLANQMSHRLGAHMELKVLLEGIILVIKENTK